MRLPAPLLRRKSDVHKNTFGHVLIVAGSPGMAGAAALCALSTMRSGAGLATVAVPRSLNSVMHKKMVSVIMTLPLTETKERTISPAAYEQIQKRISSFDAIAIGPGLSRNNATAQFILKIIALAGKPLVIDADALNAVARNLNTLKKSLTTKILTPHPGEMSRLTGLKKEFIEKNRMSVARKFSRKYRCIVILKGPFTIVAAPGGQTYRNTTGNSGMATAGSGDVLTGMVAAFLAQGLSGFDAAKYAVYLHGKAGDLAAHKKTKLSMIATDIIDRIPDAVRRSR